MTSPFLTKSHMPNSNSAKCGAHKGARAHVTIFQSTIASYIAECLLATFATKNLACYSLGT